MAASLEHLGPLAEAERTYPSVRTTARSEDVIDGMGVLTLPACPNSIL